MIAPPAFDGEENPPQRTLNVGDLPDLPGHIFYTLFLEPFIYLFNINLTK